MPTTKKRLNITLPEDLQNKLEQASLDQSVSYSQKALEWIQLGAELDEDVYFTELMKERDTQSTNFISHESAWA